MTARDSFAAWMQEAYPADDEQRIRAMRERISRETGVPAELLTGDTEASCQAYADQLRRFVRPAPQYPALQGGSVDHLTVGQDSISARDKFADLAGQALSFDPSRRPGGWKRII
jgi:hypothetical protein